MYSRRLSVFVRGVLFPPGGFFVLVRPPEMVLGVHLTLLRHSLVRCEGAYPTGKEDVFTPAKTRYVCYANEKK